MLWPRSVAWSAICALLLIVHAHGSRKTSGKSKSKTLVPQSLRVEQHEKLNKVLQAIQTGSRAPVLFLMGEGSLEPDIAADFAREVLSASSNAIKACKTADSIEISSPDDLAALNSAGVGGGCPVLLLHAAADDFGLDMLQQLLDKLSELLGREVSDWRNPGAPDRLYVIVGDSVEPPLRGLRGKRQMFARKAVAKIKNRDLSEFIDIVNERRAQRRCSPGTASAIDRSKLKNSGYVEKVLGEKVVGQKHVVKRMAEHISHVTSNIRSTKNPAKFVFAGPPGVGKTHMAKQIAKILGHTKPIVYNMGDYKKEADMDNFLGSPVGIVGKGNLVRDIRENPNAVILLDEVEKGHKSLTSDLLLPILEGVIKDKKEHIDVPTGNITFILATNCYMDVVNRVHSRQTDNPYSNEAVARVKDAVKKAIENPHNRVCGEYENPFDSAAFFSRIGLRNMFFFMPHGLEQKKIIANHRLEAKYDILWEQKRFELFWEKEVPLWFAKEVKSARELEDLVEENINNLLTQPKVVKYGERSAAVVIYVRGEKLDISIGEPPTEVDGVCRVDPDSRQATQPNVQSTSATPAATSPSGSDASSSSRERDSIVERDYIVERDTEFFVKRIVEHVVNLVRDILAICVDPETLVEWDSLPEYERLVYTVAAIVALMVLYNFVTMLITVIPQLQLGVSIAVGLFVVPIVLFAVLYWVAPELAIQVLKFAKTGVTLVYKYRAWLWPILAAVWVVEVGRFIFSFF